MTKLKSIDTKTKLESMYLSCMSGVNDSALSYESLSISVEKKKQGSQNKKTQNNHFYSFCFIEK